MRVVVAVYRPPSRPLILSCFITFLSRLFRCVALRCVSFRFVSFRFVSLLFVPIRFAVLPHVAFRFFAHLVVTFRYYAGSVSGWLRFVPDSFCLPVSSRHSRTRLSFDR